MIDGRKWAQQFPFALGGKACPECSDGWLHEDYVRDPATQDHWRGVEALVCDSCDYAEHIDDEP